MMADYAEMGALDKYDDNLVDHREFSDNADARMDADRALNERDNREGRGRRGRGDAALESETEERSTEGFRARHKRMREHEAEATGEAQDDEVRRQQLYQRAAMR